MSDREKLISEIPLAPDKVGLGEGDDLNIVLQVEEFTVRLTFTVMNITPDHVVVHSGPVTVKRRRFP